MNISISNLIDNATTPGAVDPLALALEAEWPMKDDGVQTKGPVAGIVRTGGRHVAGSNLDGIRMAPGTPVNFSGNYTFAISVSFIANPTGTHPIWDGVNGVNKYGLEVDSGDWEFHTGTGKVAYAYGTWSADRWDRVVCVYDGSNYILYINGVSVATGASGDGALYITDILQDSANTNNANANGAKMEIYSAAWTAYDVTFDYNEKNSADGLFVFDNGSSAITYSDAERIYPGGSFTTTLLDYSGNSVNASAAGGYFTSTSFSAPYNSRCIQYANWRKGWTATGSGRSTQIIMPDPNNTTQGIGSVALTNLKKTSVSADEGMNFISYNGGGGSVDIPNDAVLTMDGTEGFSASFWVYAGAAVSPSTGTTALKKGGFTITLTSGDVIGFFLQATNGNNMKDSTSGTLAAGWNHICFTYDGTSESKLYLNGTETGSASSALGAGISGNTDPLYFGNDSSTTFTGAGRNMNWLGWYNRALTATEVTTVYNARLGVHS